MLLLAFIATGIIAAAVYYGQAMWIKNRQKHYYLMKEKSIAGEAGIDELMWLNAAEKHEYKSLKAVLKYYMRFFFQAIQG